MLLSEVVDKFWCSKSQAGTLDPLLGFGTYLTGTPHTKMDQNMILSYADEKNLLLKGSSGLRPTRPNSFINFRDVRVDNDLYVAEVHRDGDGIYHIRIPGFGPHLSTYAVEHDWRFLLMSLFSMVQAGIYLNSLAKETVVMEVYWGDRCVKGHVRPEFWSMITGAVTWAIMDRPETPGPACDRCNIRGTCPAYEKMMELPGEEDIQGLRKAEAAQKLLLALMVARAAERAQTERRRTLTQRLAALTEDNKIDVHGLFTIPVDSGDLERYPYGPTRVALEEAGLWRDEYGAIALRAFKAAIPAMPAEIRGRLDRLKLTETKEPDIRATVSGFDHSIRVPLLRGVRL